MASTPPVTTSNLTDSITALNATAPLAINIPPFSQSEIDLITASVQTSLQIAKINSDIQDIDVNIEHINKLTAQIQYTTNCDNLQKIVKRNLAGIESKAKKAIQHELDLVKQYLPISSLPSPNPVSIVKWLGKLILGPISPQLEAQIKYTLAIVKLGIAVEKLVVAVEAAAPRLEACAIQTLQQLQNEILNLENQAISAATKPINTVINNIDTAVSQLQNAAISTVTGALGNNNIVTNTLVSQINAVSKAVDITTGTAALSVVNGIQSTVSSAAAPALQRVSQMQQQVTTLLGSSGSNGYPIYDTSNTANFLTSAIAIGNTHAEFLQNYESNVTITSSPFTGTVTSGNNQIIHYDVNTAVSIGQVLVAADGSIPANTTAVSISNTPGSFSATISTSQSSVLTMSPIDSNVVIGLALTSTDPAFANGCTVTNVYNNLVTVSAPYLGTTPNTITLNYIVNAIIMSNNATSSNTSASITFNQIPIPVAGT